VSGGLMPIDQTASLSFNGTRYATLTINGMTYTIDLGKVPHLPVTGGPLANYN
jgi:hypothetical protein